MVKQNETQLTVTINAEVAKKLNEIVKQTRCKKKVLIEEALKVFVDNFKQ